MARWLNKVNTSVYTIIHDVHPIDLVLGVQIGVKTLFNVFNNRAPRVVVINKVPEARSIHHRQPKTDSIFFNVCADGLDRDSFWDDVEAGSLALLGWIQRGIEESIDKSGFSKTGFACLLLELPALYNIYPCEIVPTTITLKLKPLRTLFLCHWFGRLANPT